MPEYYCLRCKDTGYEWGRKTIEDDYGNSKEISAQVECTSCHGDSLQRKLADAEELREKQERAREKAERERPYELSDDHDEDYYRHLEY